LNIEPAWLRWAKELQNLAQAGLTYSENHFDRTRYARILEIAAEIMAAGGAIGADEMLAVWRLEDGYTTPKVDVRAVVFDDQERILLVQEKADGLWTPPGGWADPNDSPKAMAAREVREEAGVEVRPVRLLAVYDRSVQGHRPFHPFHTYKLFIHCAWVSGTPTPGDETLNAGWFAEDAIPPLSESRILPRQIARMYELWRDPSLPPDLD
jgi:ADP-ribose pyrophosphatase YjhB (NUDIX family)